MGIAIPAKATDVDLQCDSWTAFCFEASFSIFGCILSQALCSSYHQLAEATASSQKQDSLPGMTRCSAQFL